MATDNRSAADVLTAVKLSTEATLPNSMSTAYMTSQLVQASSDAGLDAVRQSQMSAQEVARLYNRANMVTLLNEGANANDYVTRVLMAEDSRLSSTDTNVRREHYKLRTKHMMYEYLNMYYKLGVVMLIVTTIVTLIMLLMAALWRANRMSIIWFVIVVAVLFAAYVLFMVLASSLLASRDRNSWTRINWRVTKEMSDEIKRGPRMEWKCASVSTVPLKPSCTEAAVQYRIANQDVIRNNMYDDEIPSIKNLNDPSVVAWAHYNINGRKAGFKWDGDGCESKVPCITARGVYSKMYGLTANQDAWTDFQSRKSTSTPRVWPGVQCQ